MHELTAKIIKGMDDTIVSWLEEKVLKSNQNHLSLSENYKKCIENRKTFGLSDRRTDKEIILQKVLDNHNLKQNLQNGFTGPVEDIIEIVFEHLKSKGVKIDD